MNIYFLLFIDFFCLVLVFSAVAQPPSPAPGLKFSCFDFPASCFSPFSAVSSIFPFLTVVSWSRFSFFCFSGPRKRRASEAELDKLDEKSQILVLKNFKPVEEYEELRSDYRAEHTQYKMKMSIFNLSDSKYSETHS